MIEIGSHENPGILIVDDEIEVLKSLADLLRKDFHVFATTDVDEALNLLGSRDTFSLIISDQRMPGMTGNELLAKAAEIRPNTARILLTGYADIDAVVEAINHGQVVQYVTKPWDTVKLPEMLKPIAERHRLLKENQRLIGELATLNEFATGSTAKIENLQGKQSTIQRENKTLKAAYDKLDKSFWHLRKIQEVLPICLACGKVKTTDSSWEDVVSFLQKNSMFLSHGYCPECAEKVIDAYTRTEGIVTP
jgi:response regulator RpfG family c-di-GMP phosphodiesterase